MILWGRITFVIVVTLIDRMGILDLDSHSQYLVDRNLEAKEINR